MLLDDLDRTFDIESAVETDDVTDIRFERRAPKPGVARDANDDVAAALPDDAPAELVDAAELLISAGYRISRADGDHGRNGDAPALSPRELEVLALLAEGAPNKVIARRMDISVHTAKFHVASIIAKLGATNRTDATATAIRQGLIPG
ncbi:MAG: helix-turn-helix transcriptional regulator [Rhizobiaceae bacterium]|nr:helix-turn-helix transcriptional regulator [Rhizobiaceae bacterium]